MDRGHGGDALMKGESIRWIPVQIPFSRPEREEGRFVELFNYNIYYNRPLWEIMMSVELKVTQVGSSLGVVLPKQILDRLKVGKGDRLHVVETPTGIVLTPLDPEMQEQLKAMDEIIVEYRETLEALSK